jgi:hypothetical protein
MNLFLVRKWFTDKSVTGELLIGEDFECFTLEDTPREGEKVPGKTAIPEGIYKIIITPSARFKRDLPFLVNVPGFEGIRIHAGNEPEDTQGCILVGLYRGRDFIGQSKAAFDKLFGKIEFALASGEFVTISVSHEVKQV